MTPAELNLSPNIAGLLQSFFTERSQGLLVMSGPTGSGKTTTVDALLSATGRQVVSLDEAEHGDFPPNTVIVNAGDIRLDAVATRTAAIAARFLTIGVVRSGRGLAALRRLEDMGVDPMVLRECRPIVVTQQLCKRLCPYCARPWRPEAEELKLLKSPDKQLGLTSGWIYRATGCSRCSSGYEGHVAVMHAQAWNEPEEHEAGLLRDGLLKLMAGLTTMEQLEFVLL